MKEVVQLRLRSTLFKCRELRRRKGICAVVFGLHCESKMDQKWTKIVTRVQIVFDSTAFGVHCHFIKSTTARVTFHIIIIVFLRVIFEFLDDYRHQQYLSLISVRGATLAISLFIGQTHFEFFFLSRRIMRTNPLHSPKSHDFRENDWWDLFVAHTCGPLLCLCMGEERLDERWIIYIPLLHSEVAIKSVAQNKCVALSRCC